MPPSRDDEPRTQREHEYAQTIARLERELHRLRCEYSRVCEELDYRDEKIRVMTRVIERLA